ncbi:MAG: NAD(P)-dependent oxidoreductase [Acidobacteriota bacterium]|nr:NAD(P)-dependent oxidoreductase [Acidobacteriota bacterium]
MRVLITGAAGLVGAALADAYRADDVTALRHRDLDITDGRAVREIVQRMRPDVVFNCAVIGVDDCEVNPELAESINVTGPMDLAAACEEIGAAIVHFSSNYVFDGERTSGVPYTIDDDAQPVNVYGVTKLRGEHAVAAACRRAFIVRTSWVFGEGKNSFLSTVAARLARGERVQAITDTSASSTYVHDLTARVMQIVECGVAGTYQIVNDGVCSYESFAVEAARLIGCNDDVLIQRTSEAAMARLARRPRWTPMRCLLSERLGFAPMRTWPEALAEFVRTKSAGRP